MSEFPATGIAVQQCLFGYSGGHRLLARSSGVSEQLASEILPFSDRVPGLADPRQPYWTGVPFPMHKSYALMKTWAAPEMPRPGCVWTHALVITFKDIAQIPDMRSLWHWFDRPSGLGQYAAFERHLDVPRALAGSPVRFPDHDAIKVVRAIYEGDGFIEATSPVIDDDLIFALWSQQWPRLRRSFSFQTGVLAAPDTAQNYDAVLVRPVPSLSSTASNVDHGRAADWELAAAEDLSDRPDSPFRRFLWRYGSDVRRGKTKFPTLASLYGNISREHASISKPEAIERVFEEFPEPQDAVTLKADILGVSNSPWSMVVEAEPVFAIKFLLGNPLYAESVEAEVFEAGRLRGVWEKDAASVVGLIETAAGSKARLAGPVLDFLASEADPSQFLKAAKSKIKAIHALASRRPELLDNAALSTLAPDDLTGLLRYASSDRALMLRLAKRLFKVDDDQLARQVSEALGEAIIPPIVQSVINADETPMISHAWSKQIGSFSGTQVASCVLKSAKSTAALARGIQLMNFDISAGISAGVVKWASQIRSLADDVTGKDRQELQSFLLALALVTRDPASEPLFEFAFENVHSDIGVSRLPYHAFSMIEPLLVRLPWYQSWDTCLRLRISVVDAYVQAGLSKGSFRRLARNDDLMSQLTRVAKDSKRGRDFINGR